MRKKLKIAASTMVLFVSIWNLKPISVFAVSNIQSWYLVDSGKHLDYDGDSSYMSYVPLAASIWNNYKSGVIRPDQWNTIEDVYYTDISENNGITGTTYSNGVIELNDYILQNNTIKQILNTITHETGHALGLDHGPSTNDIMYFQQSTVTYLSQNDKDSYDASYARF